MQVHCANPSLPCQREIDFSERILCLVDPLCQRVIRVGCGIFGNFVQFQQYPIYKDRASVG